MNLQRLISLDSNNGYHKIQYFHANVSDKCGVKWGFMACFVFSIGGYFIAL